MSVIPIQHRLRVSSSAILLGLKQALCDTRVAIPAVVVANRSGQSFDSTKQTVSVQPVIQEVMRVAGVSTPISLPVLDEVPFQMPRAGGWTLTMPPAIGDECLVVFSDMAFDHWWQSGGVQQQPDGKLYRHDIGDGIAIMGITSNPRALSNYSTTSAQLRSEDGSVVIDLAAGRITLNAAAISALSGSGTALPLVTSDWLTWFNTYVLPHITLTPGTPPAPVTSTTAILKGE